MVVKSRQALHSADTRRALVAAARRLWSARGYGAASLDEVCARAGVTKGALYHHFRNKEDLFLAVYAEVEEEFVRAGSAATDPSADLWDTLGAAGRAFLDVCARPDTSRIVVEAPVVLGWERARAVEREHALGQFEDGLEGAVAAGILDSAAPRVLAQLLSAVFHEAGMIVAASDNDDALREQVENELDALFDRMRSHQG